MRGWGVSPPLQVMEVTMVTVVAILAVTMIGAASGAAAPQDARTSPLAASERAAVLAVVRAPVVRRLGRPVRFRVERLARDADWLFLIAEMQDPSGGPIHYAGTPLAGAEAEGMVSRLCVALLRRDGARWRLVDHAVGPTDMVWADWPARYGAPRAIFP